MNSIAINVKNIYKRYQIGAREKRHTTFYDVLSGVLKIPWQRFRQLRKGAGPSSEEFYALQDVSLEIGKGEVVGLIGHNGAGKSTILKILSKITYPTKGRIELFGRVGSLLEVGTGFHPELSGRENIYLNGAILGMKKAEIDKKFDEIVSFAEVEKFLDTPVKRYSSGMYVRLAFAVAAHLEPEILLVDEVLAVGDVQFQKKCLGKMKDVSTTGRTVVFVSHNMPAIQKLCTRVVLFDKGRIAFDGDVNQGVYKYVTKEDRISGDGTVPIDAPRIVGTKEALLCRVDLLDREGSPISTLSFRQDFQIQLTFQVQSPIDDAAIEIGISTLEGIRILTFSNMDGNCLGFYRLEPGLAVVVVQPDVVLLPGQYAIDVYMHHIVSSPLTIDWVDRTLVFEVLRVSEVADDPYVDFGSNIVRGSVRPKSVWNRT